MVVSLSLASVCSPEVVTDTLSATVRVSTLPLESICMVTLQSLPTVTLETLPSPTFRVVLVLMETLPTVPSVTVRLVPVDMLTLSTLVSEPCTVIFAVPSAATLSKLPVPVLSKMVFDLALTLVIVVLLETIRMSCPPCLSVVTVPSKVQESTVTEWLPPPRMMSSLTILMFFRRTSPSPTDAHMITVS